MEEQDLCDKCHQPLVDPKKEENERLFRENMRAQVAKASALIRKQQDACSHIAGCVALVLPINGGPTDPLGRTSIVWHTLRNAEVIGICTTCQRIFRPADTDYAQWRRKRSLHRPSSAGIEEPLTAEDRNEIRERGFGNYHPEELWAQHYRSQKVALDDLPDEVINILYNNALEKRKAARGY